MLGFAPPSLLVVALRDGLSGALGHRQGPDQDELQERRQAGRARGRPVLAVSLGRAPDRVQERAQGRRLLPRRPAAHAGRLPGRVPGHGRARAHRPARQLEPDARPPRPPGQTAKFTQMFSNNRAVNVLAAARIFLFAARDVWFVVALPFFLYSVARLDASGRSGPCSRVGDRLRRRPGGSPALRPPTGRRPRRRARRQDRDLAGARTGAVPRRDRAGPHRARRPDRSRSSSG